MIAVDTNVWSEFVKRTPDPRVLAWEERERGRLAMPTMVLAEWWAGAALMPEGRNKQALAAIVERIADAYRDRLIHFDEEAARLYGTVLLDCRRAGKPIMTADAIIAATARRHGMPVATRNHNDFAGAGLELINPWEE